jgi:hypothetical protein
MAVARDFLMPVSFKMVSADAGRGNAGKVKKSHLNAG